MFNSNQYCPVTVQALVACDLSVLCAAILRWFVDGEAHSPRSKAWDVWGKQQDQYTTSEGWEITEGMVAIA